MFPGVNKLTEESVMKCACVDIGAKGGVVFPVMESASSVVTIMIFWGSNNLLELVTDSAGNIVVAASGGDFVSG